jgi:hypothetical protein
MFPPVDEEVKKATFPPEVVDEVKKYMKDRGYSIERFADIAGVGESTLYRLFRDQSISHKSLVAIYKAIHGGDHVEVLKDLAQRNPENKPLQQAADNYKNLQLSFDVDPELIEFFCRDRLTFRLFILLTYDDGVSREIVRDEMGKMGIELFDELLTKNKLIEVKPGCFRVLNNRPAFQSGEVLQKLCGLHFELFDSDTYLSRLSAIGFLFGWITEEAFAEAKNVLMSTGARLIEIIQKNPGPIPFSSATGLIRILDDVNFQKNREGLS